MGFDKETYGYLLKNASITNLNKNQSKADVKTLNQKFKVGLSYMHFLYQTLEKVLIKLNQKAPNPEEKLFIENFCALSYFRIPEFRTKFIDCLKNKEDDEWRGMEWAWDHEDKPKDEFKNKYFTSLFDWEKNFYTYLKSMPKGAQYHEKLIEALDTVQWRPRIAKRGMVFYSILAEWCRFVFKTTIVKDLVPWNELPGYKVLVNSFLVELKTKNVLHYPANLKEASIALLLNEKLLNIFVMIVYKNTRLYDNAAVCQIYDLINMWLQTLQLQKKNIPPMFDYSFFFKGIKLVIEQEHALSIAKCLCMIYNNFQIFMAEFTKELCGYLFSSIFFKLFMHWVYHLHRNMKTNLTNIGYFF